jgi:hypothetical protein
MGMPRGVDESGCETIILDLALRNPGASTDWTWRQMTPDTNVHKALGRAQDCLTLGDGPQAVRIMQDATRVAPNDAAVLTAWGVALRFTGDFEAAALAFSRAIERAPQRADAQVYLGMIRLAQGRQKEGWPLYQARWRNVHWTDKLRYPRKTLWRGQATPGLRLLLWGEQGFGDTIQFARYAPWLMRLLRGHGAGVALEVPASLCALLRSSWPFMDIFSAGEVVGRFDAHLPLMDLPHLWGNLVGDGGLPYEPMPVPYLSALTCYATEACRQAAPKPLRVGVAWQGRRSHPDDRYRSIHLRDLAALFAVPGIVWVSLQKDAQEQPAWLSQDVVLCRDFSDTARIADGLDLVISIDSAVAHLAAALGKPVWLLLPRIADWRWQLVGNETPWYPSMRIFRQGEAQGWVDVIGHAAAALARLADAPHEALAGAN